MSFRVDSVLRVIGDSPDTFQITEEPVLKSWVKDYDIHDSPTGLPDRFDLKNWGIILVAVGDQPNGGCIIAHDTQGVNMLQGRHDLAVLWDIRVAPDSRGQGLGRKLFDSAVEWASSRGCIEMHIETQNINAPACRFYEKMGCRLIRVSRNAYAECPGEDMFLWSKTVPRDNKTIQRTALRAATDL